MLVNVISVRVAGSYMKMGDAMVNAMVNHGEGRVAVGAMNYPSIGSRESSGDSGRIMKSVTFQPSDVIYRYAPAELVSVER